MLKKPSHFVLSWLLTFCLPVFPWMILQAQSQAERYRRQALKFSQNQQWDYAIEKYQQVLRLEPNDPDTHYNLALALKYKGEPQAAVKAFEAALHLKPRWVDAHFGLGATYYTLHNQSEALHEFRSVLELNPKHARAHYFLG